VLDAPLEPPLALAPACRSRIRRPSDCPSRNEGARDRPLAPKTAPFACPAFTISSQPRPRSD
jgi:hypothetical protein